MRIEPLGDSALLVQVVEEFDPDKSLDAVLGCFHALELAKIPGVVELAPASTTIGVFFDQARIVRAGGESSAFEALTNRIGLTLHTSLESAGCRAVKAPVVEVSVCYEDEFALDLADVARHAGLSHDDVIQRHSDATYRVTCVGFTPGFPYLSGLPRELATPRRATPRKEIPAGAVAIGGTQTGIYPRKSPGGWNIIGRTPLRLFDVQQNPPAVMQAGDEVRFRKISRSEFEQFSA
ncbi:MAG TPA: 5-oxoprolinase subunit PxpB [Chthoniobacterales bacterium]|nr:5-oxoprolinase subunit PxpB [Chthoniobacterales bacterium]